MSLVDDANSLPQILKGFYTAPSGPTEALWQELSGENSSFCNINTKKTRKKNTGRQIIAWIFQFGEVEHHNPFFVGLIFFFDSGKGRVIAVMCCFGLFDMGRNPEATERWLSDVRLKKVHWLTVSKDFLNIFKDRLSMNVPEIAEGFCCASPWNGLKIMIIHLFLRCLGHALQVEGHSLRDLWWRTKQRVVRTYPW